MKKSVMLVLVFIFSIYSASACVEPTDGMIITENTTFCEGEYNLPTGVIIDNNNLVLDCNGASLIGSQTYSFGIFSYDRDNFVIKNCVIENYYTGIKLTSGVNSLNNIKIENNIISGYGEGIGIDTIRLVNGLIRVNNIFDFGEAGINFNLSDNNFIYSNSIYSSNVGILLDHGSKNNELIGNFLCNNDFGLSCFDSENNFGSSNRFDFIENNEGCDFVGFSECTDFSGAQCSLRGGMCSNSIHPGEINLGNCINKPYKELPNIADASDGIRFSSEKNSVIDRIKLFFKNLFVRQSKEILIQNNNCIVSVRSLDEFTVPRCFSGTNGWVNLCSPMMGEVYSYSNSSFNYENNDLISGQFCSIENLRLYENCINGDYYIDPATCHDLNEAYNLFGTEVAESTGYNDGEFDWALEWTDSGANSWHESGDYYCGYCGDDLLGPHETNVESESSHWCNDSTFEVVDESSKCYCPSEEDVPALPVVESDGICSNVNDGYESNENDEGHNNGCHDEYSDEICTYGICSNGECMKQYPMEVPDCGGNEWYNDLECTNPTDQCYLGSEHGSYCLGAYGCGGPIQVCGDEFLADTEECEYGLGDDLYCSINCEYIFNDLDNEIQIGFTANDRVEYIYQNEQFSTNEDYSFDELRVRYDVYYQGWEEQYGDDLDVELFIDGLPVSESCYGFGFGYESNSVWIEEDSYFYDLNHNPSNPDMYIGTISSSSYNAAPEWAQTNGICSGWWHLNGCTPDCGDYSNGSSAILLAGEHTLTVKVTGWGLIGAGSDDYVKIKNFVFYQEFEIE